MSKFSDSFDKVPGELNAEEREERERMVAVTLPIKYWLLTLAAIEKMNRGVDKEIQDLRSQGKTEKDLNEVQASTLIGPKFIRAALVEMLVQQGVMKAEAREKVGYPMLNRMHEAGDHKQGPSES
jgi:hypothetical protein